MLCTCLICPAERLARSAEEVLGDPEFVESCNRELHFRTTASQFDYKNIISDYKARGWQCVCVRARARERES